MKVLLDTDLGNDIDDAICLSYLLAQPRCELLGVTTVTAGAQDRARLASALCVAAGRDEVPIGPGSSRPLEGEPLQEPPLDAAALLARWPHRDTFDDDAVSLMRRVIRAHPGEVTLVAIGALTNVARLFQADPVAPSLLRSLVLMGGEFLSRGIGGGEKAEWNTRNDPAAAALVYAAGVPQLRAVGLDVTRQVRMDSAQFRARFTGPLLEFAEPWLARRDGVTFHDPLAAVTVFQPEVCGYTRGTVTLDGAYTLFAESADGPHEIAGSVRPELFFEHFFGVVSG